VVQRTNAEWLSDLQGQDREQALGDLRGLLIRGLRYALANWPAVGEQDIEDFAQEALLKIIGALDSFQGQSQFTTWAIRIGVNVAFSELRRRRWRNFSLQDFTAQYGNGELIPYALVDAGASPSEQATQRVLLETVQRVIAEELTERQQQALTAVMLGGVPMAEVARRMGTNRNALYKLIHDARCRLKDRLLGIGLSPEEILSAF
jgi:RNA polymerase sigma-70 factor (ECF subfamily)